MLKILLVGLGGFFGSIARYAVSRASFSLAGDKFPLGTLLVNVSGSLLMGCVLGFAFFRNGLSDNMRLFLGVGLIGGFTTFSAFSAETLLLFGESRYIAAAFSITANLILSIAAVSLGMWLVKP